MCLAVWQAACGKYKKPICAHTDTLGIFANMGLGALLLVYQMGFVAHRWVILSMLVKKSNVPDGAGAIAPI